MDMVSRAREKLSVSLSESNIKTTTKQRKQGDEDNRDTTTNSNNNSSTKQKKKKVSKKGKSKIMDELDNFNRGRPTLPPTLTHNSISNMNMNMMNEGFKKHRYDNSNVNDNHNNDDENDYDDENEIDENEASGELLFDVFSAEAGFQFQKLDHNVYGLDGVSRPSSEAITNRPINNDNDNNLVDNDNDDDLEKKLDDECKDLLGKLTATKPPSQSQPPSPDKEQEEVQQEEQEEEPSFESILSAGGFSQLDEQNVMEFTAPRPPSSSRYDNVIEDDQEVIENEEDEDDHDGKDETTWFGDLDPLGDGILSQINQNIGQDNFEDEDDWERRLNDECELLRTRLENTIDGE